MQEATCHRRKPEVRKISIFALALLSELGFISRLTAEKVDADTSLPRIDWPPETLPPTADIVKLATSNDMVASVLRHADDLFELGKFISQ